MSHVYLGKLTLFWCDRCNVPVLGKKCAKCGGEARHVEVTPPGDIRPAFPFDIDLIRRPSPRALATKATCWPASSPCSTRRPTRTASTRSTWTGRCSARCASTRAAQLDVHAPGLRGQADGNHEGLCHRRQRRGEAAARQLQHAGPRRGRLRREHPHRR